MWAATATPARAGWRLGCAIRCAATAAGPAALPASSRRLHVPASSPRLARGRARSCDSDTHRAYLTSSRRPDRGEETLMLADNLDGIRLQRSEREAPCL